MSYDYSPTRRLPLLLAAVLLFSRSAAADCVLPAPPAHIPDGHSANDQEMHAAMRTIEQYNRDVEEYTQCLQFEGRRNLISISDQETEHNEALSTLKSVVDRFNEQIRIFKARHS